MESNHEESFEIRAVIKFLTAEGESSTGIHKRLCNVYGTRAPAYSTVAKWAAEFKRGRKSLEDDPRSGRPQEATTPEKVAQVQAVVEENPHLKAHEIAYACGVSKSTAIIILHQHLNLSKVCARWIPHNLSEAQMQNRAQQSLALLHPYREDPRGFVSRLITGDEVWVFHHDPFCKEESREWTAIGSPAPVKVRQQRSAGKVMATIYWDSQGVLLADYLPHGRTINGEYFGSVILQLHDAVRSKRRGKLASRPLLLIDNAPAHSSVVGQAAIHDAGFTQLQHPPYSPDLAPSDYYLFRHLKKHLRGKRFAADEELIGEINLWFDTRPDGFYSAGIEELPTRWTKCNEKGGVYFEKL